MTCAQLFDLHQLAADHAAPLALILWHAVAAVCGDF